MAPRESDPWYPLNDTRIGPSNKLQAGQAEMIWDIENSHPKQLRCPHSQHLRIFSETDEAVSFGRENQPVIT